MATTKSVVLKGRHFKAGRKNYNANKKQIYVVLHVWDLVRREAKRLGIPRSQVVRRALEAYFKLTSTTRGEEL